MLRPRVHPRDFHNGFSPVVVRSIRSLALRIVGGERCEARVSSISHGRTYDEVAGTEALASEGESEERDKEHGDVGD